MTMMTSSLFNQYKRLQVCKTMSIDASGANFEYSTLSATSYLLSRGFKLNCRLLDSLSN